MSTRIPGLKRKVSNTSSPPNSDSKKLCFPSDNMVPSPKKPDPKGDEHSQILRLLRPMSAKMDQLHDDVKETNSKLDTLDQENKQLIADNARQISNIAASQTAYEARTEAALDFIDRKVERLADMLENGCPAPAPQDHASRVKADHEKQLLAAIEESKHCVTVLGTGDQSLTIATLSTLLSRDGYSIEGKVNQKVVALFRLGGPVNDNPPYKVVLDSHLTAESLRAQSRTKTRGTESSYDGIRFVRHFPPQYARAARDFRQTAAIIYENGGLAEIEYEGTTLTLRGKSRENGGEWLIMGGGEFKPLAVGRQTASEEDDPSMSRARALMAKVLDNGKDTPLAKSLKLFTRDDLGSFASVKNLLGDQLSAGLVKMEPVDQQGSMKKYTLLYNSRAEAIAALDNSRRKDTPTGLEKGLGWLALSLPVVAP